MSIPTNPLAPGGVRAKNPPDIKEIDRDPTAQDYRNYTIGDFVRNTNTKVFWQLADTGSFGALWVKSAGPAIQIDQITTSDAVAVEPVAGNVNLAQGNGILTTGAGSTATVAMSGTFSGTFAPTNLNLATLTSQMSVNGKNFIDGSSTAAGADGEYCLVSSTSLQGHYTFSYRSTNRWHQITAAVNVIQFASSGSLSIISNDCALGIPVITNLRLTTATTGVPVGLMATVINTVGDGVISVGHINPWPDSLGSYGDHNILPTSYVPANDLATVGFNQDPSSLLPLCSYIGTSNTAPDCFGVVYSQHPDLTVGNGMGSAILWQHQQADKTLVSGARLQTISPDSGTNVQTTSFHIEINDRGTLRDCFLIQALPGTVSEINIVNIHVLNARLTQGYCEFTYFTVENLSTVSYGARLEIRTDPTDANADNYILHDCSSTVWVYGVDHSDSDTFKWVTGGLGVSPSNGVLKMQLDTSGNFSTSGNISLLNVGSGIQIKSGTNARIGTSTLVLGTITIANTSITANTQVRPWRQSAGASTAIGNLSAGTITVGTSFVINSLNAIAAVEVGDLSVVGWELVEIIP